VVVATALAIAGVVCLGTADAAIGCDVLGGDGGPGVPDGSTQPQPRHTLSDDGDRLLFVSFWDYEHGGERDTWALWLWEQGAGVRLVWEPPPDDDGFGFHDYALSADGSTALAEVGNGTTNQLLRFDIDAGGAPTEIVSPVGRAVRASLSGDGSTVAFTAADGVEGPDAVYLWTEHGSEQLLDGAGPDSVEHPASDLSAEGSRVLVSGSFGPASRGVSQVYDVTTRLPVGAPIYDAALPAVSADGGRVGYVDVASREAVVVEVGGDELWSSVADAGFFDLSSDGSTVAWHDGRTAYRSPVEGEGRDVPVRLGSPFPSAYPYALSGDGSTIAATVDSVDRSVVVAVCGTFGDVAPSHPFVADITWMDEQGISTGYATGDFQPAAPVSRQAMAAFLHRFAGAPIVTPPASPTFPDVALTHAFSDEVEWMADEAIAGGFADGTFRPLAGVTRQAMSAFLFRVAGEPASPPPSEPAFSDVSLAHPFSTEVEWMAVTEISTGYVGGTYRPALPVSRQAMSAFLHRLSELD
jgi:hypothetical protein